MSITIKVYYEKTTGAPEIRRFPVATNDAVDCFVYTVEKIRQLYSVLAEESFQLHWKDSDGDRIAFNSADEMKDALNYVTDGVFRIYIPEVKKETKDKESANGSNKPRSPPPKYEDPKQSQQKSSTSSQSQSQSQSEGPLHPGVTCDGCEGPVKGIRYKCCQCSDYDLCSVCEGKGLHSEHDMYKITQPRTPGFCFVPPQFSSFMHMGAHNAAHDAAHAAATAAASAAANAASASFGQAKCNIRKKGQTKEEKRANHDDYLKNVGANIAAFLDPFGIDVTYDVHHNNGQRQQGHWSHPPGSGPNARPFWTGGHGCPAWEGMERRAASSKPEKKSGEGGADDKKNSTAHDSNSMETDSPAQTKGKDHSAAATAGQDIPMEDNSKEQNSDQGSDEWTFVPDDGSEVRVPNRDTAIPLPAPSPKPTPTSQSQSTPDAPKPQETANTSIYPDLRLQQSLETMLAMGFTNPGNWLSELLADNNCDIGQTLDAIKAKATQQLDSLRN